MTPSETRSPYSPVAALGPSPAFRPRTFSTTTDARELGVEPRRMADVLA
jgi:hypothetical protein